jgi:hypothetical protein
MGRLRTACGRCASIKSKCTQQRPCNRCTRLGLDCAEGYSTTTRTSPRQQSRKIGGPRSYTGCLNCRRRRQKCDEQLPACGTCRRLRVECVPRHEDRVYSAQEATSTTSTASASPATQASSQDPSRHLTIESPRRHAISDWMALIEDDNSVGAAKGASLANSAALVDLPLPCARDDEVGMSKYQPTTALSHLTGVTSQAVKDWTIVERYLLTTSCSRSLAPLSSLKISTTSFSFISFPWRCRT